LAAFLRGQPAAIGYLMVPAYRTCRELANLNPPSPEFLPPQNQEILAQPRLAALVKKASSWQGAEPRTAPGSMSAAVRAAR
jgi:hypothetical protein